MSTQVEPVVVEAAELEEQQVAMVEQPPLVVDKQLSWLCPSPKPEYPTLTS